MELIDWNDPNLFFLENFRIALNGEKISYDGDSNAKSIGSFNIKPLLKQMLLHQITANTSENNQLKIFQQKYPLILNSDVMDYFTFKTLSEKIKELSRYVELPFGLSPDSIGNILTRDPEYYHPKDPKIAKLEFRVGQLLKGLLLDRSSTIRANKFIEENHKLAEIVNVKYPWLYKMANSNIIAYRKFANLLYYGYSISIFDKSSGYLNEKKKQLVTGIREKILNINKF